MNSSPRPHTTVHRRVPHVQPSADATVGTVDDQVCAAADCGWYESSFALRQGLAVSELDDSDGSLVALWFAPSARPLTQAQPGTLQ